MNQMRIITDSAISIVFILVVIVLILTTGCLNLAANARGSFERGGSGADAASLEFPVAVFSALSTTVGFKNGPNRIDLRGELILDLQEVDMGDDGG